MERDTAGAFPSRRQLREKKSSTILVLLAVACATWSVGPGALAGDIHEVKYANQADVKVFRVKHENQADLCVYVAEYTNQAKDRDEVWHYVEYANQADAKIFFVRYENQADLKVYFVKYPNQAKWKKSSRFRGIFK